MKNIVILLSGRGSNFEAILRASRAENWEAAGLRIAAVVSNRPDAKGLATARAEGLETVALDHKAFATREAFDEELARRIAVYDPAMRCSGVLGPDFFTNPSAARSSRRRFCAAAWRSVSLRPGSPRSVLRGFCIAKARRLG